MKVVTSEQMRQIERLADERGLSWQILMDNAGLAFAKEVQRITGGVLARHIAILVGPGNNGGDGLVAARHFHDWGAVAKVILCSPRADTDHNCRAVLQRGIPVSDGSVGGDLSSPDVIGVLSSADVIVDALFGTGKSRPIEGLFKEILDRVKRAKQADPNLSIIALDLPSGLNADTGEVDPASVPADVTVTLGYPKRGLFAPPGLEYIGKLSVVDIGIPPELAQHVTIELITPAWAKSVLPKRPAGANKGTFGKVLVIAGSINYIGAAYLACSGAIRMGAGLVTLATAESLQPILASKLTEVTYVPLPEVEPGVVGPEAAEIVLDQLQQYDVLLMGCGMGQHPSVIAFIEKCLLAQSLSPESAILLDADALNALAKVANWWQRLERDVVLTPHPGEMSRLTGLSIADIQSDRLGTTLEAAKKWDKTVVLKGANTVTATPQGSAMISPFANAGLASAGTGDVLAGVIAGLMAQGLPPFDAAACGVYLHAEAGEMVKKELGDAGMVASDLLPLLPKVINELKRR